MSGIVDLAGFAMDDAQQLASMREVLAVLAAGGAVAVGERMFGPFGATGREAVELIDRAFETFTGAGDAVALFDDLEGLDSALGRAQVDALEAQWQQL